MAAAATLGTRLLMTIRFADGESSTVETLARAPPPASAFAVGTQSGPPRALRSEASSARREAPREALLRWLRPGAWSCLRGMRLTRRADLQDLRCSAFAGFRFPPEVIVLAVRWLLRFRIGSRSDRLEPVYVIVKKACRTFDKGARCFATAARVSDASGAVLAGSPEERTQHRATDCGILRLTATVATSSPKLSQKALRSSSPSVLSRWRVRRGTSSRPPGGHCLSAPRRVAGGVGPVRGASPARPTAQHRNRQRCRSAPPGPLDTRSPRRSRPASCRT
jgi:hypothetical protein